jgi:hypothetical protein
MQSQGNFAKQSLLKGVAACSCFVLNERRLRKPCRPGEHDDKLARSSHWRKWELQVHSRANLAMQICDIIGFDDYFSVSGYREIFRGLNDPGAAKLMVMP